MNVKVIDITTCGLFSNKYRIVFEALEDCRTIGPLGWCESWLKKGRREIINSKNKAYYVVGDIITFNKLVWLKWNNHIPLLGDWQVAGGV